MTLFLNNENKINYFINNLPEEIVHKMYIEYINPEIVCTELNLILNSIDSIKLNYKPHVTYLKKYKIVYLH